MELYLKENINMRMNQTVLFNTIVDLFFYPVSYVVVMELCFRMFLPNSLYFVEILKSDGCKYNYMFIVISILPVLLLLIMLQ